MGGHFTTLGGSPRNHLAALSASGGLTSWNPTADGALGAFGAAITSSRVAFGGEFDNVGDPSQAHEGVVQFSGAA